MQNNNGENDGRGIGDPVGLSLSKARGVAGFQQLWLQFTSRDVKTVYFSKPVTGLPKPVFYRLPKGLL